MSFSKMFCSKSPFKKSEADKTLVEGAGMTTKKIKNKLEGAQKGLSMVSDVANVTSSFVKRGCKK